MRLCSLKVMSLEYPAWFAQSTPFMQFEGSESGLVFISRGYRD